MKNGIKKIIITLLVVMAMLIGIMPFADREIRAESKIREMRIKGTDLLDIYVDNSSYTIEWLTLSSEYDIGVSDDAYAGFSVEDIIVRDGSFTFSSSIGPLAAIVIVCKDACVPKGWRWNGTDVVEWASSSDYSATITDDSEAPVGGYYITGILEMIITVEPDDVTGISLNETSIELKPNETKNLIASLEPSTAAEKEVKWSSSDKSVAKVDDKGAVTAVTAGTATITATATNGTEDTSDDKTATCTVTVRNEDPVVEYRLWVGGNQVTSKNKDDILGDGGKAKYDPDSNTLALNNANITGTYNNTCIYADYLTRTFTISLTGDNNVGNENARYDIIVTVTDVLITGDGSLTVSGGKYGIDIRGASLKIKDTTVTVSGCSGDAMGDNARLEIDNSTVIVSDSGWGISFEEMTINNSRVDVKATNVGIVAHGKTITISGDSYVSSDTTGSGAKAAKPAIFAVEDIDIADLDIIEPEEGKTGKPESSGMSGFDAYVLDKDGNIAPKAIIAKTYTIKFLNDDGTVLQEKKVPVYETPEYEGDTPVKESDDSYTYTFKGWDKEITEVKGDATYTAVYDKTPIEKPTPDPTPTPVTPFDVPKTGIEGPSPSYHLISLLGVCAMAIFLTKKHN